MARCEVCIESWRIFKEGVELLKTLLLLRVIIIILNHKHQQLLLIGLIGSLENVESWGHNNNMTTSTNVRNAFVL